MLSQSFIFLPGVQSRTENRLWQQGISNWNALLTARSVAGIGQERLLFWKQRIRVAQSLLDQRAFASLARLLGQRNSWRLYPYLLENPRFIDIETTEYRDITLIGVSDGEFYQAFVKGRNLSRQQLHAAFTGATCLITFNGSSFDLPLIERAFPGLLPKVPHIDLRHVCAQAGFHGGLKAIEQELEIKRGLAIRDLQGTDAIMLWYRHVFGDPYALELLVDYNAADVLNLQPLAEKVIEILWQRLQSPTQLPSL